MLPLPSVLRPRVFAGLPDVVAGFSTRHEGVSDPPYDTLNLGFSTEDDRVDVAENRRRFCDSLGVSPDRIATAGQVHGDTVRVVDGPGHVPDCDGLVTAASGVLLSIGTADCAAVLLTDADAAIVGACHSGWRGTVAHIAEATVETMTELGADPSRIRAYVSPCIGMEAFEVGPEVATQFDAAYVHEREDWRRPHVDLKQAIRHQLTGAGLAPHRIVLSPHCTMQNADDFFSYRADNGVTGRMLGAIGRTADANA